MNWDYVRQQIELLKKANGWSDNELERRCGVPQPTISRFLNGTSAAMELENLMALARGLNSTVSELIGERPLDAAPKARVVLMAMHDMPDYKQDVVVSTAQTLAKNGDKRSA